MWIFLDNAFLSIVDKGGDGSTLLVRARRQGDLERIFPGAEVRETPDHDYRFRTRLVRAKVAEVLAEAVKAINYPNFKGSVRGQARHNAYLEVWEVMYRFQDASGHTP